MHMLSDRRNSATVLSAGRMLTLYVTARNGAKLQAHAAQSSTVKGLIPFGTAVQATRTQVRGADGRRWSLVTYQGMHGYVWVRLLNAREPTVPGPLDGQPTPLSTAMRRPIAILIDNAAEAGVRPQSGLRAASLVLEAKVEGGVTRFLAFYLEQLPRMVGPVRSTRIYFNHWAEGWDAIFVHWGGDGDAKQELGDPSSYPFIHRLYDVDLETWYDEGTGCQACFMIMPQTDVRVEHTHYAYPSSIYGYVTDQYPWSGATAAFSFKAPATLKHRPAHCTIVVHYAPDYVVKYVYDHASNRYLRYMGYGFPPHLVQNGAQIAPSNIVVLQAQESIDPNGDNTLNGDVAPTLMIQTEAINNSALYFRDGTVRSGTWSKQVAQAPLVLVNAKGTALKLNPGQTWVEVVPSMNYVSYTGCG